MQDPLKSCPFCGGSSDGINLIYNGSKNGRFYYVECEVCGARTKGVCRPWMDIPDTNQDMWDCQQAQLVCRLWNRRANNA